MPYDFFEIPSYDAKSSDIVFADPLQPPLPAFVHYGYAIGSTASTWTKLSERRGIPLKDLRNWLDFQRRHSEVAARLRNHRGYIPGESVLRNISEAIHSSAHTAMRLGALELVANIFSGRVTASDKDPFPHQLALQQFMRAQRDNAQRVLIADEVGLGKTIEVGLVLRDLLVSRSSLDDFSCLYLTSGGLVQDAVQKLRSVLKGAVSGQNIVSEVNTFKGFGRGNTRGVHVASMHAARLYTAERKQELPEAVNLDVLIIDECHHCASDIPLSGAHRIDRQNATLTYTAAHQMIEGLFWPDTQPPRLVILMSATPFRNANQFANLLRLLTHQVNGFNAYSRDADGRRLVDQLRESKSRAVVVWRRQDDAAVRSWSGGRLFPNLTIIRPHRDQPGALVVTSAYLEIISEIRRTVKAIMRGHRLHFGGFSMSQLEKKLTSSSIAGACYLFSWCLRHSSWATQDAFLKDTSTATENLRRLIVEISRALASFDLQSNARHSDVYLPSEGFTFEARVLAQEKNQVRDIFALNKKLREAEQEQPSAFVAAPEEIERVSGLALRLLRFSGSGVEGVENAKLRWLKQALADHKDSRFLVFTESLQTCAIVRSAMPRIVRTLTGEMGSTEREEVVAEFRNPKSNVRVLVATSAADEGFDLQVANRVVHWDLSSSPAVLMQRNGRVARLGQISDVTAYYLILPGTHEEKRDSALLERFAALGVDDARLQLKILGTLTEEEQESMEDAVERNDTRLIGEILVAAQRGSEDMERQLSVVRRDLDLVSVLDREQMADRLEAWTRLGLPEQEEDVELTFARVPWNRPLFGERTVLQEAFARSAKIQYKGRVEHVTFDPEFKVFSSSSRHYDLAGLRPWIRQEQDHEPTKIRPDEKVDILGSLTASLARLPRADFATLRREVVSVSLPELGSASYLLFVSHPMREAETGSKPGTAPYLTFYAFGDSGEQPYLEGNAAQVHRVISLLETEASVRIPLPTPEDSQRFLRRSEQFRAWILQKTSIGAGSLFEEERYSLPIPIALVAVVDGETSIPENAAMQQWDKPCIALFEHLAKSDPVRLTRLIDGDELKASDLTFAAEIAGKFLNSEVVTSLLRLLDHESPLVREGAIYGLSHHRSEAVNGRLRDIATSDPSPGVREAAASLLEEA